MDISYIQDMSGNIFSIQLGAEILISKTRIVSVLVGTQGPKTTESWDSYNFSIALCICTYEKL